MKKASLVITLIAILVGCSRPAVADTIGPNCGSCQGATYTLTNLGAVGPSDTYAIELQINTTGFTGLSSVSPPNVYIGAVAVKVSSHAGGASIVFAPDILGFSSIAGAADWHIVNGGINSGGCSGAGGGFECGDWIATGPGTPIAKPGPGNVLTWVFNVDTDGGLFSGTDMPSIKVQYVDNQGHKIGSLVSESIRLGTGTGEVPEPASFVLLASGLAVTNFVRRRKAKNSQPS